MGGQGVVVVGSPILSPAGVVLSLGRLTGLYGLVHLNGLGWFCGLASRGVSTDWGGAPLSFRPALVLVVVWCLSCVGLATYFPHDWVGFCLIGFGGRLGWSRWRQVISTLLDSWPPPPPVRQYSKSNQINVNMLTFAFFLAFSILFVGLFGFLQFDNLVKLVISLELILLSIGLFFLSISFLIDDLIGANITLFLLPLAGAESAIALAILVAYLPLRGTLQIQSR